jgi:hypothetical protein
MRNLFRRASFLFWQYPILWLPIVIIDPLVLGLNLLDEKMTHAIILSLVTRHSVLGSTPEPTASTSFQIPTMLFLTKPVDWGTHLIALYLYVCAMMTIFTLISMLRSRQELSLSKILSPLQQSFSRLVFFSLKLLIVIGIAAIPFLLFTFVFFERNGARYISIQNFSLVIATLPTSAIAYFMAPAAMKLLRPHNFEAITPERTQLAKISAALAVVASDVLYFFAVQVRHSFVSRPTSWSGVPYEVVASLVSATPYIVLFIALSLLAEDDRTDNELFGGEPGLI